MIRYIYYWLKHFIFWRVEVGQQKGRSNYHESNSSFKCPHKRAVVSLNWPRQKKKKKRRRLSGCEVNPFRTKTDDLIAKRKKKWNLLSDVILCATLVRMSPWPERKCSLISITNQCRVSEKKEKEQASFNLHLTDTCSGSTSPVTRGAAF